MPVALNDILEVKIGYTVAQQQCFNVLHYRVDAGLTTADPFVVQQLFIDEFLVSVSNGTILGDFKAFFGQNVYINKVTAQFVYPTRYLLTQASRSVQGAVAGNCDAPNVTAVLVKYGAQANRANRGSVHVGGIASMGIEEGILTITQSQKLIQLNSTLSNKLITQDDVWTFVPCILNKEKIPNSDPVRYRIKGSTDTVQWTYNNVLHTQRTRNVGRGI